MIRAKPQALGRSPEQSESIPPSPPFNPQFSRELSFRRARLPSWRGNLSMNQPTFAISRFENRNGVISWRVDGRLHGSRIRKNFKTREEAAAEKSTLELKAVQPTAGMRSVLTFLSDAQLRFFGIL